MMGRQPRPSTETLTSKLVEHLAEHPGHGVSGDVTTTARNCLAAAVELLAPPPAPAAVRPPEIAGFASRWAREGIALETVLGAYHDEIRNGLEFLADEVADDQADHFLAGARLAVHLLEMVTVAASTAYVDEHRAVAREHQTAAQTLVSALLGGHAVGELARETGIPIARSYQVVALGIPAHPDERRPGTGADAARRKLRRVQAALADPLGSRALSVLSAAGGTVLVPIDDVPARTGTFSMTDDVLAILGEAAEVPLTAAVTTGRTARIPELAGRAHDLLDRLRAAGRPPGLYPVGEAGEPSGCEPPQPGHMTIVDSPNDRVIGRTA
ncbi:MULTISPECIES: transcriptional regulator [Nocardia]|uniref:transcriptional regulator n=1 Tax=Nocardia TaxID=1817 RepID=UPI001CBC8804|nr:MULTISPECIES: transcriptional regulator [Nocardia]